jgi:hypothetical protein
MPLSAICEYERDQDLVVKECAPAIIYLVARYNIMAFIFNLGYDES